MMSYKVTGVPLPQAVYGHVLEKIGEREQALFGRADEAGARIEFRHRADAYDVKIAGLPASLEAEREAMRRHVGDLRVQGASVREIAAAERALAHLPRTPDEARAAWSRARDADAAAARQPAAHAEAYPGDEIESGNARLNFLTLVICLMVGTASLPHVLMRYYTTPSVRAARQSVFWSLFFILLLYITAPAYAVSRSRNCQLISTLSSGEP